MKRYGVREDQDSVDSLASKACRRTRTFSLILIAISAVVQVFIDGSTENVASSLIVLFVSSFTILTTLRREIILAAPAPILIVLGFNFATMSGALVAQSLSFRALIFNMKVPITTFGYCSLYQMSLLLALFIYLYVPVFSPLSRLVQRKLISPLGANKVPSHMQLWIMGFIGCAVNFRAATLVMSGGTEFGDAGGKILDALSFFIYAPLLIPFIHNFYPQSQKMRRGGWMLLLVYLVALVGLGIAKNSRSTFAAGFLNIFVYIFLLTLLGQMQWKAGLRRRFAFGIVALIAVAPFLSNLATAMVMVRADRNKIEASELISRTVDAVFDSNAIKLHRETELLAAMIAEYEENYISNPLLARFIRTKFTDNALRLEIVQTGERSDAVWDATLNKLLAILPTPVLNFLGLGVDKSELIFSIGDILYYLEYGVGLGGFRTGSPLAQGWAMVGPWILFFSVPFYVLMFLAMESLTMRDGRHVKLSPVLLLQIGSLCFLACGDSMNESFAFLVRNLPQNILIYVVVFFLSSWMATAGSLRRKYAPVGVQTLSARR